MKVEKELVEDITLDVFNVGSNKVNFKILKMLPSDVKTLMKNLNRSKVRIYVRINELEKVGLVELKRGTGEVVSTNLTKCFLDLIYIIEREVKEFNMV